MARRGDLTYVRSNRRGLGAALAEGTAAAQSLYVVHTDDDCETPPEWAAGMADALRRSPDVALVYSNVIAEGSSTAAGIAGIVPTDQGKIRGEIDPDVNWDFGNGCLATLAATVRFGEGMLGGSASLNLRKQF